jgi:flagellin
MNIPASSATSDTKSNTFASSSSAAASAIAIAAAINSKTGDTGVIATANGATVYQVLKPQYVPTQYKLICM